MFIMNEFYMFIDEEPESEGLNDLPKCTYLIV